MRCACSALVQCVGTDTLATIKAVSVRVGRKQILTLGSTRFKIASGHSATLTIKLSKKALKLLAKTGKLKVRETVVAHDQRGVPRTTRVTVTLKLPKKAGR